MSQKALPLLAFCLLAFNVSAESPAKTGRLADGRAYRLDQEGNEIVDYIAELELNVESLNRRVGGLEDELQEKNQQIERLTQGRAGESGIKERDLIGKTERRGAEFAVQDAATQPVECPVCPKPRVCAPVEVCDCSFVHKLYSEKAGAEEQAQQALLALQQETAALKGTARARESELQELKLRLEEADKTVGTLRAHVKAGEERRLSLEKEVESAKQSARRAQEQSAPQITAVRIKALDSIKSRIQNDYNQLKGLIAARDARYQDYSAKQRTVAFKPSLLVSARNLTVKDIGQRLEQAASVYALSILAKDIADIRAKAQEDIALMQRMERVK